MNINKKLILGALCLSISPVAFCWKAPLPFGGFKVYKPAILQAQISSYGYQVGNATLECKVHVQETGSTVSKKLSTRTWGSGFTPSASCKTTETTKHDTTYLCNINRIANTGKGIQIGLKMTITPPTGDFQNGTVTCSSAQGLGPSLQLLQG